MHEKWRHALLGWWADWVCRHAWVVMSVGVALALLCIIYTVGYLRFEPDRNALISPDLDWNQRYIDYQENFAGDDLIVVVDIPATPSGPLRARHYVDTLAAQFQQWQEQGIYIRDFYFGFNPQEASPGLIRTQPIDLLRDDLHRIEQSRILVEARSVGDLLSSLPQQFSEMQRDPPTAEEAVERLGLLTGLIESIRAVIEGADPDATIEALADEQVGSWQYLTNAVGSTQDIEESVLLMMIAPRMATDQLDPVAQTVGAIRAHMQSLEEAYPEIEAGLTGIMAVEADETIVSTNDATRATILAVIVIGAMLWLAFHTWKLPAVALLALMIGIAWSFGFLTLSIGHLQVLSVVFTVILLGLGIDFAIHIISRLELVRHSYPDGPAGLRLAMVDTFQNSGPGIVTGAVTTACAFGTTLFTDFQGMAEMGLIAGVGVILCLFAMMGVFPALMRLMRPRMRHVKKLQGRKVHLYRNRWWRPFTRMPLISLLIMFTVLFFGATGMQHLRFDSNLLNLLPRGVSSVTWQQHLIDNTQRSVWFGVSMPDDLETARQLTYEFHALPTVEAVGGVGRLYSQSTDIEQAKATLIAETRQQMRDILEPQRRGPLYIDTRQELIGTLDQLNLQISGALILPGRVTNQMVREALRSMGQQALRTKLSLQVLTRVEAERRITAMNEAFKRWQQTLRQTIDDALDPRLLTIEDLPRVEQLSVVGRNGHLLLEIYPREDVNNPEAREAFIADLRSVDPQITGTVMQIEQSADLIQRSYMLAGGLAFSIVFMLVLVDFRRLIDALLCLTPVVLAFVTLLGTMGWLQWLLGAEHPLSIIFTLNPANVIVLPLLFGIGVDCGIHVMHRYRQDNESRPLGLSGGTGKGITLTSLTTMIGFACMLIAHHRGIVSLGFTLTTGMLLTLIACLMLMPAILELHKRWTQ